MVRLPPSPTLFPYTTLFRSRRDLKPDVSFSLTNCRRHFIHALHFADDEVQSVDEMRSEEHTSELQSRRDVVCRLLLVKKKAINDLSLPLTNADIIRQPPAQK